MPHVALPARAPWVYIYFIWFLCECVFVHGYVGGTAWMLQSEDNLGKSILSYHVAPEAPAQVSRLGSKCGYPREASCQVCCVLVDGIAPRFWIQSRCSLHIHISRSINATLTLSHKSRPEFIQVLLNRKYSSKTWRGNDTRQGAWAMVLSRGCWSPLPRWETDNTTRQGMLQHSFRVSWGSAL